MAFQQGVINVPKVRIPKSKSIPHVYCDVCNSNSHITEDHMDPCLNCRVNLVGFGELECESCQGLEGSSVAELGFEDTPFASPE